MSRKSTTNYQIKWVEEFPWVKQGKPGNAYCVLCKKEFSIGSMGRTALTSHEKGKKHSVNIENTKKTPSITFFMQKPSTSSDTATDDITPLNSSSLSSTEISSPLPGTSSLVTVGPIPATAKPIKAAISIRERYAVKENVTAAEILWCLNTVMLHLSLRSAEASYKLFQRMFTDSEIARDMRLGKDKIGYTILYGLAPYFESNLRQSIHLCKTFVVGFDESLNKVSQSQQMDISIRYWNELTNIVSVRYLTSIFLHNSTAVDLFSALKEGLQSLDMGKIIQFSMDGPNVNLKLLRLIKAEIRPKEDDPQFLEIGTCGLHVINGAFKTGMNKTGWNLLGFFRALYYLFKDSPARRGVFISLTNSSLMPLKFCSVRWLENVTVVKRIQEMLPHLKTYIDTVSGSSEEPASNSYRIVKETVNDPLIQAKLAFFQSLAEDLEPFLREFQTNAPMVPFLFNAVSKLLTTLMSKFVLPDIIEKSPINKINVFEKCDGIYKNLKKIKEIDLGYATKAALRKCSRVSDKDILNFRKECRTCLQFLTQKLMEKSPIAYPFAESLTFLNPSQIVISKESSIQNMTGTFEHVLSSNWLAASTLQNADREYRTLISSEATMVQMRLYCRSETRLDAFWFNLLDSQNPRMENLLLIIKMLLPLSHGNAALERGFSINKDLLVENLKNDSLKAQRMVYDSVVEAGGLQDFVVTKELILSTRNANAKWKKALEERREKQSEVEKATVAKRKATILAKELEEKKRKMIAEMDHSIAAINEEIKKAKSVMKQ